jgi:hypothetical protein
VIGGFDFSSLAFGVQGKPVRGGVLRCIVDPEPLALVRRIIRMTRRQSSDRRSTTGVPPPPNGIPGAATRLAYARNYGGPQVYFAIDANWRL